MNSGELKGKRVVVQGLGRFGGGIAVSKWLVEQGASVLVTDQANAEVLASSMKELEGLPIEYRLGEHREEDFAGADLVVPSPAVPPGNAFLTAAREKGVPITTEIRLFIERCPARIIGITGTKGKSTTTALLGRMLEKKYTTWVGGNIGKSLLFELPRIETGHLVVLELSSFMLEYLGQTKWSPHVAVVTLIATDHLDRHGTFENYVEAKKNMLRYQTTTDFAVLNEMCRDLSQFISATPAKVILYGLENRKRFELKLPGEHNQLNAQAAFAAAGVFDVSWAEAQEAVRGFGGLPHRLQLVHEHRGVKYYNDSIATIPEAAVAAMESFEPKRVIQIVGGYDKHIPLTAMCAALVERAKAVLCIGKTGATIAKTILDAQTAHDSPKTAGAGVYECGDLPTAMKVARQIATGGDVVLLSTGCASYDQFPNFEVRGEMFVKLAREG
ncbi:MAG: UDP-N-acetylmuramoyl-L-alanine--D-glutamate ligase [Planctomycetota bacterium]|nr:UDP-N-acetylmuramoyl-L-alanine--D-glutamate ligase [Planctomycetota bacterium]